MADPQPNANSTGSSNGDLDRLLQRIDGLISGGAEKNATTAGGSRAYSESAARPVDRGDSMAVHSEKKATDFTPKLGNLTGDRDEPFIPRVPDSLEEAGLSEAMVEGLIIRFLMARGEGAGRAIAEQVKLPFLII